jgi:hypothetical protein
MMDERRKTMEPTFTKEYCIEMIRQSINFAEMEHDFAPARKWVNRLEASIKADSAIVYEDRKQDDVEHNAEMLREGRKNVSDYLEHEGYETPMEIRSNLGV